LQHQVVSGNTMFVYLGLICVFLFILSFIYTLHAIINGRDKKELSAYAIFSAVFATGIFYASVFIF